MHVRHWSDVARARPLSVAQTLAVQWLNLVSAELLMKGNFMPVSDTGGRVEHAELPQICRDRTKPSAMAAKPGAKLFVKVGERSYLERSRRSKKNLLRRETHLNVVAFAWCVCTLHVHCV